MVKLAPYGVVLLKAFAIFLGLRTAKHFFFNPGVQLTAERLRPVPAKSDRMNNQRDYGLAKTTTDRLRLIQRTPWQRKIENDASSDMLLPPGKELRFLPISSECKTPEYLEGYGKNLCWKIAQRNQSVVKVTCLPRLVILGVDKCGQTDLRWQINALKGIEEMSYELFNDIRDMKCPIDFFESNHYQRARMILVGAAQLGRYLVINGGSIFTRHALHATKDDHYLVRTAEQHLSFFRSDTQRYMILLRNPTDRLISHYFFMFSTKQLYDPIFSNHKTAESIGNKFFHDIVQSNIEYMWQCLGEHGVTGCVYLKIGYQDAPQPEIYYMITIGCYYIYIEQILKFIPQNQFYINMLEQYSANRTVELNTIFDFMGLDADARRKTRDEDNVVQNTALTGKPVLKETRELLDKFYKPFNLKLSSLLEDEKWLWRRP